MKIGYGVSVLSRGLHANGVDGIGTYTRELANGLIAIPGLELNPVSFGYSAKVGIATKCTGLTLPAYSLMAPVSACLSTPFPGHTELKRSVDLFHATDHLIPRLPKIPVLATLMDAIPLSHPEWVRLRHRKLKIWLWKRAATWADHVVTISEYSKTEIVEQFDIAPEKISVIPLGVDQRYFEIIDANSQHSILEKLQLPQRFFLFIGTLQPRKNVERILQAHASLPLSIQKDFPMVIIGRDGWGVDALLAQLAEGESRGTVRWLKYLPDFEVRTLMQCASAMVFPSLCEGYGLPVIEAFASRLPVITSNTTALPELAEGAALMVNPTDVEDIANAMQKIIGDPALADNLRQAGFVRAKAATWSACAEKTHHLYQQIITAR